MSAERPYLSVIVPAFQGSGILRDSLGALLESDLPRAAWELVVVDDGSTDETSWVAAEYADTIVRLAGKPHGPAYARNRGSEVSRGEVLVFIDADVRVHRDTLRRFTELFSGDPSLAAAFGSYDDRPPGAGLVSQFRNLMHHYVHHRNAGEAETFWAGCGAVRTDVFRAVGMFDEWHYTRPQIEDIELGRRLRVHGHRIRLAPEIQGSHLKRWTLWNGLMTDLHHRGVPWMWLILEEGPNAGSRTLNVRTREKICTALAGLTLAAAAAALALRSFLPLLVATAATLTVIALNSSFYAFLRRHRGWLFTVAAVPLHLMYFVVNGFSVIFGGLMQALFGEPLPSDEAAAQAELGIETWPPGPRRPARSMYRAVQPAGSRARDATDEEGSSRPLLRR
ncbi:MAG: glycosyltransferase [Longimicrobiales bacterium]